MKAVSKLAIAIAIIMGLVAILSNQSVDAVPLPSENEYVIGPFEATGYGVTQSDASADAWFEVLDQFYGPGGHIETLLSQGLSVVSLDISSQGYESPEYTIVYTITVCGPQPPIDFPTN